MKMRFLKKFVLAGLVAPLLFSLLSFTNAVSEGGEVIIIRVIELPKNNLSFKPKIIVIEGGKAKEVELVRGLGSADMQNNLITLSNTLQQYYNIGYKITASTYDNVCTTYILTK